MNVKHFGLAGAVALASLFSYNAQAALGGARASVQADAEQLRGTLKSTALATYQVHEIQLPSGTMLREYAGKDGAVFAVVWRGPTPPNLRQALGAYFDNYVSAAKANRLGHNHLQINTSELVVHAAGHMRMFSGVAYLPQELPGGFDVGALK